MNQKEYPYEVIVANEGYPFKMFAFEGEKGNYIREKHWHHSIEIFALWEGGLEFTLQDQTFPLKGGEFVLVNSNEVHSIQAKKPNRTVVLQIPQQEFVGYFTDEDFIWFSHSDREDDQKVFLLLQEMFLIDGKAENGSHFQVLSLYYELLYLLVTKYRKLQVHPEIIHSNRQLQKLSPITAYLKEHYGDTVTLESLAKEFGYSTAYLSRMFQKYAGISFKQYLLSVRMEHAARELEETKHAILDIAVANGFPNGKAFSDAFRKQYGVLPSEYRKQQEKNRSKN